MGKPGQFFATRTSLLRIALNNLSDGQVEIWDLASASKINDVQVWDITTGQDVLTYRGIPAGAIILATSWSPDNKSIASLDSDGLLLIWSPLTGQTLHAYRVPPLATPGLMWSPDGKLLALSGGQNILEVLQVDG